MKTQILLKDGDYFYANGRIREYRDRILAKEGSDRLVGQVSLNEIEPILLNSDICKKLTIYSNPPMASFVMPNQETPIRTHSKEERFFNENINLSGDNLYEFTKLNKDYLAQFNLSYVHELQHHLISNCIFYNIKEIK